MEAVKDANQLSSENLKAVKTVPLLAAEVEVKAAPEGVRIAAMLCQHVKMLFPVGSAIADPDGIRQSPVKGIALGNAEQLDRSFVDEVRQLVELIIQQSVTGAQRELALDLSNGGQLAEDDQRHK